MSQAARLGAFIFVTLAILLAGVFIIGSKEYLFSSTYQLKTQFDNVAGLAAGADVQVAGVHSGTVRSIVLPHKPGEKVTVVMDLNESTHEIVKRDSVASIETEGLLGNQYVAVSFGSAGQGEVRSGELIGSLPPLQISDLLKKTSGILDGGQLAVQNATAATAHLNSITSKIDSGQGTVGALVNDKQLYANLQQTTETMRGTMVKAQTGVTDFQENMEALKHNFLLSGYFKKRGYDDSSNLTENAIDELPADAPLKEFDFSVKDLFDSRDSAKLKNQKSLKAAGEFLANSNFGLAVVTSSGGSTGDTQKELILSQARSSVIRTYLVQNFGFDDSQLRTMGTGKEGDGKGDSGWGSVKILVYPESNKKSHDDTAPTGTSAKPSTKSLESETKQKP